MNTYAQTAVLVNRLGRRAIGQRANRLLSLCIVVCTGVAASLGFFANSIQYALDEDIANYLGAPMVVRADRQLPLEAFVADGVDPAVVTRSFTTGAISNDAYQSVSLKGVSIGYPLQGELIIATGPEEVAANGADLATGAAWLDQRVMSELSVSVGDQIQIGNERVLVAGRLVHEPDRLTQFQHALPRVMVNLETLANTKVGIVNDRGEHRVLLKGSERALEQLEKNLSIELQQEYRVLRPGKGQHPFSRISIRAERFLNVILVLILLMCGGAAASLADHSVRRYAMPATVLRCMGVNRNAVAWALCLQLVLLGLVMSLVGCLLGWAVQPLLIQIMQPQMTLYVTEVMFKDLLAPIGIGLVTVIAFVVPKLQELGSISVSSVLRGQLEKPKRFYLTTLIASVLVFGILWYSSDNLQLTAMLVAAVVFLVLLSVGFGWGLSKVSAQAHRLFKGPLKVAVRSIGRSPGRHITPLASVAIAMMAILMTVTLRGSFLDTLQVQMLDVDGNYIFTGLPVQQGEGFQQVVEQAGATIKSMYPTVSARLVSINDIPINVALKHESDTREETRSKVRLAWAEELPGNNNLLEGSWPEKGSNDVSVESEVMSDLGLSLGDTLGFNVNGVILTSTITGRREYSGGGSRMMFWFMFAPSALAQFEQYYMGGMMLTQKPQQVLGRLNNRFPHVRIMDLERQIQGVRNIMIMLTRMMNATLVLLLSGALMVIVATSFVSASDRHKQSTLMRAFGLTRPQCYAMNITEQLVIALVACLVGVMGVQLTAGMMFENLFALTYQLEWSSVITLTGIIAVAFVVLGWLFAYRQLQQPVKLA